MKSCFALIFCLFAISAKGIAAQATLYSSSSTAQSFSRCVVDRLGQSQVFRSDEKNSMVGVADVMAQGLKSLDNGRRGPVSVKILLKAFVTSLADIVTHGDGSRTSFRRNAYTTAMEQCSLSTISHVDIETVSESIRILYSLEDSQIAGVREEIAQAGFDGSDVVPSRINPLPPFGSGFPPVIPSPVQRPFMPQYFNRHSETAFRRPGSPLNFPLPAQSSMIGSPPLRLPSFGASQGGSDASSVLSGQREDYSSLVDSHIAPPFGFGAFNLPQAKNSEGYPTRTSQIGMIAPFQQLPDTSAATSMGIKGNTDQLSQTGPSENIPHQVGGLSVPQMRESSVRVVPPLINPRPSDDAQSQDKSLPANLHQPSTSENPLPENINYFVTTSPALMPEMDKEDKNIPLDSTLENIVFKILTNSAKFREAFDSGINPQNALNLAQIITEQSLTGYNADLIRDALNAVSDAVARVTDGSPESYAVALSDALVHVLKARNLPLFVDGSKVATSILYNLDALMQDYTSGEFISPRDYIEGQETQLPFGYEFPATTPEYNYADTFSKALTEYILKSDELSGFFCQKNFPPDRMKIYFSLIKYSLADFGPQVSSIAASITSGNLLHLPDEVLCSSYAQTISATIADILGENGLLSQAKAESIADKMSFSLRQQLAVPTQVPDKGDSSSGQSSTRLPLMTPPAIQTSFTNNFDSSYQETSALPDIYNHPSTYPMRSSEATSYKTVDIPSAIENTTQKAASPSSNATSSRIQKSSTEAVTQSYTKPYTSDIDNAQLASATAFMYSLIPSPVTEISSSAEDKISPILEDKIDKEKLSSFLSKEIESVVSAISDESIQKDKTLDVASVTQAKDVLKSDESQFTEKPQVGEDSDPDSTTTPDVHVVKVRSSRHHSGSGQSIEYSNTTDNAYSESSSTQYPTDIDKSSFQKSQFSNKTLAASERLAHMSDILASRYSDRYIYAKIISQLAANLITFLKSKHFSLLQLCRKLNRLAPILKIPPLDYCEEYAVIDYLLHVLQSMAELLKDA